MDKHESPCLPADSTLPRPVVLSLDDLPRVAAAGAAIATPVFAGRIIIAGKFPVDGIPAVAAY